MKTHNWGQGKLLIKPAKKSVTAFLGKVRDCIIGHKMVKTDELISMLNPKIMGWARYHHHLVAKKIFGYVDDCIYRCLSYWTRRRHPEKNFDWIRKKYFRQQEFRNWIFFGIQKSDGETKVIDLCKASHLPIERHVKIREKATPYDPEYIEYLALRKRDTDNKLYHY